MLASTALFARTALVRHERDVSRMVFNDNVQLLDDVRKSTGALDDSLAKVSTPESDAIPTNRPYLVVSIEDHRLWYKQGDSVLFTTQVATGSGKVLEGAGGDAHWKFETPRGRLVIESKEEDPSWIPPDWHFVEMARKTRAGDRAPEPWPGDPGERRLEDHRRREPTWSGSTRTAESCRSSRE